MTGGIRLAGPPLIAVTLPVWREKREPVDHLIISDKTHLLDPKRGAFGGAAVIFTIARSQMLIQIFPSNRSLKSVSTKESGSSRVIDDAFASTAADTIKEPASRLHPPHPRRQSNAFGTTSVTSVTAY